MSVEISKFDKEQSMTKAEKAVTYMISVWDEVRDGWREKPDHVQQKFLDAEAEVDMAATERARIHSYMKRAQKKEEDSKK